MSGGITRNSMESNIETPRNLLAAFKPVKLFVFDVDGVLTNGTVLLLETGEMAREMYIKDGYALQLAIKKGYQILIVSGGESIAVIERLKRLGIEHIVTGVADKLSVIKKFLEENAFTASQILYMGDDIPDAEAMQFAGLSAAPADAVPEIISVAHYISPYAGGRGCVRDVIEKVLKLNQNWNEDVTVTSA